MSQLKNIILPQEIIDKLSIDGTYDNAVLKLKEEQIVLIDNGSYELADRIIRSSNPAEIIYDLYFQNDMMNFNDLIEKCGNSQVMNAYADLYNQILVAFNGKLYYLACMGLFAIIDGVLSDITNDNKTSFDKRLEQLSDNIKDIINTSVIFNWQTISLGYFIEDMSKILFSNYSFNDPEPNEINRHWIMHGRTKKKYNRLEFLKILLFLRALLFVSDYGNLINCCR